MKHHHHYKVLVGTAALIASAIGSVHASNTATQDVDITVQSINEISVGTAVTLTINSATAGGNPSGNASSTYSITTNSASSKKITAELAGVLNPGLTLSVILQAPSTGTSAGVTQLSILPTDVVTDIEAVAAPALTIGYSATATVGVAPNTYNADVTYTIVDS